VLAASEILEMQHGISRNNNSVGCNLWICAIWVR